MRAFHRIVPPLLLAGLLAACVGLHALAMEALEAPPRGDAILHLANSVAVYHALQRGDLLSILTSAVFVPLGGAPPFYPPGLYLVTSAFYGVLGTSPAAALQSQLPYLVLLGVSTWWLGRRLSGPWAGLAAAAAALASPGISYYAQNYFLDLPLAASVAFLMAASVEARGFTSRGWSVAWGLSVAMGAMAKNSFVFWGGFPVLAMLAGCASRHPRYTFRVLQGMGLWLGVVYLANQARGSADHAWLVYGALLPALGLLTWWLGRSSREGVYLHLALAAALVGALWNLENLTALAGGGVALVGEAQMVQFPSVGTKLSELARILKGEYVAALPLMLLLSLLWLCFQKPERRRDVLFTAACGGAALALNTAFVVTDLRYLLPMIVWLAVLGFLWIDGLPAWGAPPVSLAVVGVALLQFLPFTLLVPGAGDEALRQRALATRLLPTPFLQQSPAGPYPDLRILEDLRATGPAPRLVLWGVTHEQETVLQPRLFRYLALREGVPLQVLDPPYRDGVVDFDSRGMDRVSHLLVVTREPEEWTAPVRLASRLSGYRFRLWRRYPLPGGESAWLYVRSEDGADQP